jgi:hypothetical protein
MSGGRIGDLDIAGPAQMSSMSARSKWNMCSRPVRNGDRAGVLPPSVGVVMIRQPPGFRQPDGGRLQQRPWVDDVLEHLTREDDVERSVSQHAVEHLDELALLTPSRSAHFRAALTARSLMSTPTNSPLGKSFASGIV